jgi:phosphoenolpyruvate carboxykinase (ATP)
MKKFENLIFENSKVYLNLSPEELIDITIKNGEGVLTNTESLAINTGEFTGRSPKDKYVVVDDLTKDTVWWGDVNHKMCEEHFDALYEKMISCLNGKDVYIRDSIACADENYKMYIRVITETPWSNLFAYNMFLRPSKEELENFNAEWLILCIPSFKADKDIDGTRQHNFTVINFTKKILLIGGSGYTGEIKKGIFTILNYTLPVNNNVLSMHCSANIGKNNDTALFFGLSGTGKTTLSADPNRNLIGDDEHGWSDKTIFNFEGGCYAKTVNISEEKEPEIYHAIKYGSILENVKFFDGSNVVDFSNTTITENTRVSYPISYIENAISPSIGNIPDNIFFLTCDATGVLPPISKLSIEQAMYHFISGYTSKIAGTEMGVTEPQLTFSACFGKAFLPLHPSKYAEMFGEKIHKHKVNVWLVNTGWIGGGYGIGRRIELKYTRRLIDAALSGELNHTSYNTLECFNLKYPIQCDGVPDNVLDQKTLWNENEYINSLNMLANSFIKNFDQYREHTSSDILAAEPKLI